jgi:hypothetical protein
VALGKRFTLKYSKKKCRRSILPATPRSIRGWVHVGRLPDNEGLYGKRAKNIGILGHIVEAYDAGGDAAFAAALDEPESTSVAYPLKAMATYMKIPLIDLAKKSLALAQKRQASGIF